MGSTGVGLATACAVALVVSLSAFGNPPASGQNTDDSSQTLAPVSEVLGVTLPPAGDQRKVQSPATARSRNKVGRLAAKHGVGLRTYRYSAELGNASTLDVYTPRALVGRQGRMARTVILVHGGAWQAGDPLDLAPQAVQLARKLGLVVVSVSYRLATEAPWPAQRDDVNAAVDFVRDNAAKLNVDKKRMVILGSSAGGQIAASVATFGEGRKRFRGLVTLSGLMDPLFMAERNPGYSNAVIPAMLLRCLPTECRDRYRSATAATYLDRSDPPSLLFHSEKEKSWDPTQARHFARASRALGVPSKLAVMKGGAHGIDTWDEIWPTLRAWLVDRLGDRNRRS